MTSPKLPMLRSPDAPFATCLGALLIGATALGPLTGCGEEEAQRQAPVVQAPTPPPPPPPEPTVEDIASLMKSLSIDPRVNLPEEVAPKTTEERTAVLLFWNAFAKGDSAAAKGMMSERDAKVLTKLTDGGGWSRSTADLESIEVQCKSGSKGFATFAIISSGGPDRALLWDAAEEDGKFVFTAYPGPPDILDHLSGTDSITAWKKHVDEMFEKYANLPDEEIEIPQTQSEEAPESTGGGDGPGSTPTPPGGTGGGALKKKDRPPIPD